MLAIAAVGVRPGNTSPLAQPQRNPPVRGSTMMLPRRCYPIRARWDRLRSEPRTSCARARAPGRHHRVATRIGTFDYLRVQRAPGTRLMTDHARVAYAVRKPGCAFPIQASGHSLTRVVELPVHAIAQQHRSHPLSSWRSGTRPRHPHSLRSRRDPRRTGSTRPIRSQAVPPAHFVRLLAPRRYVQTIPSSPVWWRSARAGSTSRPLARLLGKR
jgi:hypothetical protein